MPVKQNNKAIREWKKENTDLIQFRVRKHEHLPERVQQAVDEGFGKSRQAYMIEAIKTALAADGIPERQDEQAEGAETSGEQKKERGPGLMEQLRLEMEDMSALRRQEVLNYARFLKAQDSSDGK